MITHRFSTSLSVPECQIRLQRFIDTMYMSNRFGLSWHKDPKDTWCQLEDWTGAHFNLHLVPHDDHTDVIIEAHQMLQRWFIAALLALLVLNIILLYVQSVWFVPVLMGLVGGLVTLYAHYRYLRNLEIQVVRRVQMALPIDG